MLCVATTRDSECHSLGRRANHPDREPTILGGQSNDGEFEA
jgi:hypothetical protein